MKTLLFCLQVLGAQLPSGKFLCQQRWNSNATFGPLVD